MSSCNSCAKSTNTIQGSVAINEGSINCTLCNNGYYASISSQTTSCNICPKGYYCPSGKIIECPKGTANNQTGRYTICDSCVKSTSTITGTYAISTKQTLCSSCTNGNYASVDKQSSYCNTCPGGYYCPNGKIIKCPVGTYSTGGAVSCIVCPAGSYSSTQGANSCIKCSAGYYSNQGAASCTKCSTKYPNCKTCNNTQCIECETNYKLSDDKQKCEKKDCPKKTIKIETGGKTLCVTQYNMGDQSEFPLVGVSVVSAGRNCASSASRPCCWQGKTVQTCDAINGGYSGCNRTTCDYYAAQRVCSNLHYSNLTWRTPTLNELAFFGPYSRNMGSSGLMLCDNSSGYGSAKCYPGFSSMCKGSIDGFCYPFDVWSNSSNTSYYLMYDGSWHEGGSSPATHARSVRCVAELK